MESDVYNILITSASNLFYPNLVLMLSSMLNCKKCCRFFVMQCDWTDEQKRTCENFVSEYPGNKVVFLNIDNTVFSSYHCFKPYKGFYEVNYKLLAHNYLPDDIERILYLDTDTLVRKDIASLYDVDFEDTFLSAALHPSMRGKPEDYAKEDKKGGNFYINYFACGCNMLNIKKFKEDKITPEFYDEAEKKAGYTLLSDEGILNFLFWDRVKLFPFYYYNFYMAFYEQYREIRDIYNTTNAQERAVTYNTIYIEDFDENKLATIVHFGAGNDISKPWQTVVNEDSTDSGKRVLGFHYDVDAEPFYLEWWETAKKLPQKIYEELVSNAHDEYEQNSIRLFTRMTNSKTFFEALALDHYNGSHNFDDFILKIKNKKLSILGNLSDVGRFFTKIAKQNGIDIVFESHIASMTRLDDTEWQVCKTADVIISCYVHGGAVLERDNIKGILLSDVINGSSLLSQNTK